jgi:hypothetical protein
MYMAYGAKIKNSKTNQEMIPGMLKNKRCNIEIELGSLWASDVTAKYGINIFAKNIAVLN